jgi:hypothetical protein
MSLQNSRYNKKELTEDRYKKWALFLEKYKDYFPTEEVNKDDFSLKLEKLGDYIDKNKMRPSKSHSDKEIRSLGGWCSKAVMDYRNDKLKDDKKEKWEKFMNKYKEYFYIDEEIWFVSLNELKEFINDNKRKPEKPDGNIHSWYYNQVMNYKDNKKSMKNEKIKLEWETFLKNNSVYFGGDDKTIWLDNLEKVIEFIEKNKKRPSSYVDEPKESSLGHWLSDQNQKDKNENGQFKNKEIKEKWDKFTDKYKDYFKSNEESWEEHFDELKEYIQKNNKKPDRNNEDEKVKKLFKWIDTQTTNYNDKTQIMANEKYYNIWEKFVKDNREVINNRKENWKYNYDQIVKFIKENKEIPKQNAKDETEKSLGWWLKNQKQFYKNKSGHFTEDKYITYWKHLEKLIDKKCSIEI